MYIHGDIVCGSIRGPITYLGTLSKFTFGACVVTVCFPVYAQLHVEKSFLDAPVCILRVTEFYLDAILVLVMCCFQPVEASIISMIFIV